MNSLLIHDRHVPELINVFILKQFKIGAQAILGHSDDWKYLKVDSAPYRLISYRYV